MILIYVDDILVLLKETSTAIDYFSNIYILKEWCMEPTNRYLGANTKKVQTANGRDYWKEAIVNMEKNLNADGKRLFAI